MIRITKIARHRSAPLALPLTTAIPTNKKIKNANFLFFSCFHLLHVFVSKYIEHGLMKLTVMKKFSSCFLQRKWHTSTSSSSSSSSTSEVRVRTCLSLSRLVTCSKAFNQNKSKDSLEETRNEGLPYGTISGSYQQECNIMPLHHQSLHFHSSSESAFDEYPIYAI